MTHVLVIGGGQNAEHDVSKASAASIVDALRGSGHHVTAITIGRDGLWHDEHTVLGASPATSLAAAVALLDDADVVFPAVHGPLGEDGTLAALCALAGRPVVGSGLRAGSIGMDKWATKLVAQELGILTAPGHLVHSAGIDTALDHLVVGAGVVVKPVAAGSSYGVSMVHDPEQLEGALRTAARYDDRILVEDVVRGREVDVAVLREAGRCWAPPPLEIHSDGLFDTATKYDGSARFTVPAGLERADRTILVDAALRMFDALGCAGVARMDFFWTDQGPVLNEVNTMPGMTVESQVPKMCAAAGVPYEDLIARLVASADPVMRGAPILEA